MGSGSHRAQDVRERVPARRAEPHWLAELRRNAGESFESTPMPVEKDRGWEFTPLEGLDLEGRRQAIDGDLSIEPGHAAVVAEESGPGVLQVDGAAKRRGSGEPNGVIVTTLEQAAAEHAALVEAHLGSLVLNRDKFSAQNTMSWRGGAFVHVPRGVRVETPVVLSAIHATEAGAMFWRSLVVVDPGAELTLVEQYLSSDRDASGYFNAVAELVVGEGATVNLLCAQDLSEQTWILGSQRAQVAREASLHWVGLGLGSGRGKLRMETDIIGRGGSARVTGAYIGRGSQHLDYETTQEHAAPDTTSDLAFRGILRDGATAVWSGMIRVDPDAQRTDAFQESRNLLLSDGTHADAVPGLEIEADDVRCTHAATVGRIDEAQLFYLMSRGLERADALRLLVEGFFEMTAARLEESKFVRNVVATALGRELERALG